MIHHLSGQMPGADEKQLTHAMLLIFSMLLEQFKSAGVETRAVQRNEGLRLSTKRVGRCGILAGAETDDSLD